MRFTQEFLDEIRTRVPVSRVVGERVSLKRRGAEFVGLSPFSKEKTPSFTVNDQKQFYHCFSSGEHGDIFSFLIKTRGLSFQDAVEHLAAVAGLSLPQEFQPPHKTEGLKRLMEEACVYFQKALATHREALAYLEGRGVNEHERKKYRLGFAPRGNGILSALTGKGFTREEMMEGGLLRGEPSYAFFRERIMFPIVSRRGEVLGFGGRFFGKNRPPHVGKYVNSPDTPLFNKGGSLYNWATPSAGASSLFVAEGYMDVMALERAGLTPAVATLGTALTETQLGHIWRLCKKAVLCFDGDGAGLKAAQRAALTALRLLKPDVSLSFAFLPQGEDPDTFLAGHGQEALVALLERPHSLESVVWGMACGGGRLPTTPEGKASLENRLMGYGDSLQDPVLRKYYKRAFSQRLWEASLHAKRSPRAEPRPSSGPGGQRRQQQIILATLVNHPSLVALFLEDISQLSFNHDLEPVRRALQTLQGEMDVAMEEVRQKFSASLKGVLHESVYALARQSRPEASLEEAEALLHHLIMVETQERYARELKNAHVSEDQLYAMIEDFSQREQMLMQEQD